MKIINSLKLFLLLFAVASLFTACEEDFFPGTQESDQGLVTFQNQGGLPQLINSTPGFFDFGDIDNAVNAFTTGITGETASSGDLTVSYSGVAGSAGPVSLGNVNIPEDINISFADVLSALGLPASDVAVGDAFSFNLTAGTSSGTYSSVATTVPISCLSALDGTYDAVTTVTSQGAGIDWDACGGATWTGQVRFENDGAGNYTVYSIDGDNEWKDISMGAYIACYGTSAQGNFPEGDVAWNDTCNRLTYTGASQWGEVYTFTKLEVNGADLTIGWTNDYGEGGETVVTRTDGDWPPLVF